MILFIESQRRRDAEGRQPDKETRRQKLSGCPIISSSDCLLFPLRLCSANLKSVRKLRRFFDHGFHRFHGFQEIASQSIREIRGQNSSLLVAASPPMRRAVCVCPSGAGVLHFALLAGQAARAGSIETFNGDIFTGKVELDFGGVVLSARKRARSSRWRSSARIYRVLASPTAPVWPERIQARRRPLRNGVRLAAPWGPFNDPVIKFPKRNLTVSAEEIAWIVYTPFSAELAAIVPGGQTGVLLPKGRFLHHGTIQGRGCQRGLKVFQPHLRPPHLSRRANIHALVLRDTHVPAAQYEVRTADGLPLRRRLPRLHYDRPGVTIKHTLYDNPPARRRRGRRNPRRRNHFRCRPIATLGADARRTRRKACTCCPTAAFIAGGQIRGQLRLVPAGFHRICRQGRSRRKHAALASA